MVSCVEDWMVTQFGLMGGIRNGGREEFMGARSLLGIVAVRQPRLPWFLDLLIPNLILYFYS